MAYYGLGTEGEVTVLSSNRSEIQCGQNIYKYDPSVVTGRCTGDSAAGPSTVVWSPISSNCSPGYVTDPASGTCSYVTGIRVAPDGTSTLTTRADQPRITQFVQQAAAAAPNISVRDHVTGYTNTFTLNPSTGQHVASNGDIYDAATGTVYTKAQVDAALARMFAGLSTTTWLIIGGAAVVGLLVFGKRRSAAPTPKPVAATVAAPASAPLTPKGP